MNSKTGVEGFEEKARNETVPQKTILSIYLTMRDGAISKQSQW
jgi:propanediol dehydratase small subunit